MLRGGGAHKRGADDHARSNRARAYACPVNAARPHSRRPMASRRARPTRDRRRFVQFDAVFENVPQAGKDRLVGAAGRLVDALPIARARLAAKSGERGRRRIGRWSDSASPRRAKRVARNRRRSRRPPRGRHADWSRSGRSRGRSLAASFSCGRAASYDNRICSQRVIAQKNSFISQKSTFRQRNVNDLSYYDRVRCSTKIGLLFSYHDNRSGNFVSMQPRLLNKTIFCCCNCQKL